MGLTAQSESPQFPLRVFLFYREDRGESPYFPVDFFAEPPPDRSSVWIVGKFVWARRLSRTQSDRDRPVLEAMVENASFSSGDSRT
jgi:hypothetical protein